MKLARKVDLFMGFLVIVSLIMVCAPAWAGGDRRSDPDCNGVGNCNDIDIETTEGGTGYGGEGGEGGHARSDADASADASATSDAAATANSDATGGSVGDITIEGDTIPADTTHRLDAKIENTPDIVTITPGSGDTCKAHIGFGVSVPGLGTSMNIPLPGKECRKLKAYDRAIAMRQWQVAEIMFCSLKEVKAEFRSFELNCVDTLTLHLKPLPPPPESVGKVHISEAEYETLLLAQVQAEDYEEQQQMVEDKFAQYDNLIEEREREIAEDDAEIERLKVEAAALRALEEKREQREMTQQSAFSAIYNKRLAQEIEEPAQEEEEHE
jgi:hypothetical protein